MHDASVKFSCPLQNLVMMTQCVQHSRLAQGAKLRLKRLKSQQKKNVRKHVRKVLTPHLSPCRSTGRTQPQMFDSTRMRVKLQVGKAKQM